MKHLVKSIGNSTTTPRDLENDLDVLDYSDGIGRKCSCHDCGNMDLNAKR